MLMLTIITRLTLCRRGEVLLLVYLRSGEAVNGEFRACEDEIIIIFSLSEVADKILILCSFSESCED